MRWSWKIARIAGIDVYLHVTFLILFPLVGMAFYAQRQSALDAVWGIGYLLLLFGIVVLHELGHALTARRYGIRTRDITLLPIGGLARLERMPRDPWQELVVALAGPAVNVVLAGLMLALALVRGDALAFDGNLLNMGLFAGLLWANVWLALFNLLPAFPMDGGRVLRALLAMQMDYVQATRAAAMVGQAMAILFGLVGLLSGQVILLLIALFVYMGAGQEASLVYMQEALGGVPVRQAMITEFHSLAPGDPLARAVEITLSSYQQEFPVEENGRLVGVLTRRDLISALSARGAQTPVGEVMQRQFPVADAYDMLDGVMNRLHESGGEALPILHDGRLVGILTRENLGEFLMLKAALRGGPRGLWAQVVDGRKAS